MVKQPSDGQPVSSSQAQVVTFQVKQLVEGAESFRDDLGITTATTVMMITSDPY